MNFECKQIQVFTLNCLGKYAERIIKIVGKTIRI